MNYTTNYDLKKPLNTETVNVQDLNDNADIIDATIKDNDNNLSLHQTNGMHIGLNPSVHIYHDIDQAIPNNVNTPVVFNSERFDSNNMHDSQVNSTRLTCKISGRYLIIGNISYEGSSTGVRQLFIKLNGITTIGNYQGNNLGTQALTIGVQTIYELTANDYVELMAYQNSGGILKALHLSNFSPEFSMVRIG